MIDVRRALPELTSLSLVLATIAAGVVVAPALPEVMIVGWHVGLDGRVSVTYGPRLLGLAAVPAVSTALYIALRVTRLVVDAGAGMNARVFEALAHLTLVVLAIGQAWLLSINL